jgi:glycosyltransferase involved in cell wall biosynthesis
LAAGTSSNHGRGPVRDLRVIPNGVDLDYFRSSSAPRSADEIVFVGRLGYHANVAGALHLMRDVMPLVWKRRPAARLTLVGADPSPTLRSQAEGEPRIRVTGHVADVPAYLGTAAVAACLLPYAVGIQNKVLEAMACGTPVVASGPACAGLDAVPGSDLLRADGADEAADAIVRLLGDQALQNSLQAAGRAYVMARHDWNLVVASLEELYQDVLARSRPGGVGQRVE